MKSELEIEAIRKVGIFTDVPVRSQFADWIEDLYHWVITAGCTAARQRRPYFQ
jgi:hypothetical protein